MTVGIAILFAVLCGVFSYLDDLNVKLKNAREMDVLIETEWWTYHEQPTMEDVFAFAESPLEKGAISVDDEAVLKPSDLELIKEKFGGSITYKAAMTGSTFGVGENPYHFLFLSDDYLEPFLRQKNGDFVVTSKRLFEYFSSITVKGSEKRDGLRKFPFHYNPERQVFTDLDGNGEVGVLFFEDALYLDDFEFEMLQELFPFPLGDYEEPDWDDYFFIPIKYSFDVYSPADNMVMKLRAGADNFDDLYELINLLNQNHNGKVTYGFVDTEAMFLRQVREQREMVSVAIPATLILLLIVGLNFAGLQLMSVKRRQRDLAIQTACGARRGSIVGGALFLTMLTVTVAALLAWVGGTIVVNLLDVELYNVTVTTKWAAVASIFGFAWLVGLASCVPSIVRLTKLSPVEILTEQ
jgi:ABC-type antimicrobial peptide transport system permease subunit